MVRAKPMAAALPTRLPVDVMTVACLTTSPITRWGCRYSSVLLGGTGTGRSANHPGSRGRGTGTAPRRCGTTEVIEDAVDHLGLRDEGNDAHGLPAAGTFQGLNPAGTVQACARGVGHLRLQVQTPHRTGLRRQRVGLPPGHRDIGLREIVTHEEQGLIPGHRQGVAKQSPKFNSAGCRPRPNRKAASRARFACSSPTATISAPIPRSRRSSWGSPASP